MPWPDIFLPDDIWRIRQAETSDRVILRTLLDDYLHGLSAFGPVEAAYPYFALYFEDADRWAYMIEVSQEGAWNPAGFALVNQHSCSGLPIDHAMAEFCVLPAFRRTGLGQYAARRLLALHTGIWELGVVKRNAAACSFWRSVTRVFDGVEVIDAGDTRLLRFESPDASVRIPRVEG
ncbi:GNAT family N-acetyltransferase [Rhizobium sp. PP-CC-3G-465]|uniref:GNAT family N-acetyltransferase n=1 Tax=Rhizobium sp. PP-CC-3G-465 TaxID=2135648 RepID=UPI00104C2991|nr:putative acetyltransferase [Rhizobium sp. PP-CC-3G-465]